MPRLPLARLICFPALCRNKLDLSVRRPSPVRRLPRTRLGRFSGPDGNFSLKMEKPKLFSERRRRCRRRCRRRRRRQRRRRRRRTGVIRSDGAPQAQACRSSSTIMSVVSRLPPHLPPPWSTSARCATSFPKHFNTGFVQHLVRATSCRLQGKECLELMQKLAPYRMQGSNCSLTLWLNQKVDCTILRSASRLHENGAAVRCVVGSCFR